MQEVRIIDICYNCVCVCVCVCVNTNRGLVAELRNLPILFEALSLELLSLSCVVTCPWK